MLSCKSAMKTIAAIFFSLFLSCLAYGFNTPPAWLCIEGKAVGFFKERGFAFSVDASMSHPYEKPTVEISISIPDRFTYSGLTNEFDSVKILSKDISTVLGTHPHAGKKRCILTMSEELIQRSQVVFYFRNKTKYATDGSMYLLDLRLVIDDWRRSQPKKHLQPTPR